MNLPKIASISKKIVVALAGLFLALFLLVHMGINLCLVRPDDGQWFLAASDFMGSNYVVKVFEIVLFAAVFVHIVLNVILYVQNRKARPVRYKRQSKTKTSSTSRLMMLSGILIFLFLILHFFNFFFVKLGWSEGKYMVRVEKLQDCIMRASINGEEESLTAKFQQFESNIADIESHFSIDGKWIYNLTSDEIAPLKNDIKFKADFYHVAADLFTHPLYSIIYLLMFIVLGIHLTHAIPSAFQTLGLNHNKYNGFIKWFTWGYVAVIVLGFSAIPVYFLFFF